jgi:NAD(P)H-nitrite reductase large subunit
MQGVRMEDGSLKPGVFGYCIIADCQEIVDYARRSKVAVTISDLLGFEAARSMTVLGCKSHVVHLAGHRMEMQLNVARPAS